MSPHPRTVKALFVEAKNTSELMLDLGYAALLFDDTPVAEEVLRLADRLTTTVHDIREVCLLAARSSTDAAELAGFLAVTDSITTIGAQAVDIAKIVTKRLGLPAALRVDLAAAIEVTDRVTIADGSGLDGRDVAAAEDAVPAARLLAIRRGPDWVFNPPDTATLAAPDTILVRGDTAAIAAIRDQAGQPGRPITTGPAPALDDLDRAVDAVVEMKNLSEAAVALAYAATLAGDTGLAGQVSHIEDRLDTMRETVETWVIDAARHTGQAASLRGLFHLCVAVETIGDAARAMIWPIETGEHMHPVLADALAETEDAIAILDITPDSPATGHSLAELGITPSHGLVALALTTDGRWDYRPQPARTLTAGDRLILTGPAEALDQLAHLTHA